MCQWHKWENRCHLSFILSHKSRFFSPWPDTASAAAFGELPTPHSWAPRGLFAPLPAMLSNQWGEGRPGQELHCIAPHRKTPQQLSTEGVGGGWGRGPATLYNCRSTWVLSWGRASPMTQKVKNICLECRRHGFDPWIRKIPGRREWLPTPVFLPGEYYGYRSLVGCSPWGHKESNMTKHSHTHLYLGKHISFCFTSRNYRAKYDSDMVMALSLGLHIWGGIS